MTLSASNATVGDFFLLQVASTCNVTRIQTTCHCDWVRSSDWLQPAPRRTGYRRFREYSLLPSYMPSLWDHCPIGEHISTRYSIVPDERNIMCQRVQFDNSQHVVEAVVFFDETVVWEMDVSSQIRSGLRPDYLLIIADVQRFTQKENGLRRTLANDASPVDKAVFKRGIQRRSFVPQSYQ